MKLFIIIILIIYIFYNESFTNTIYQYNYPDKYKNKNCDYYYPKYNTIYNSITDYEENQINNCKEYKGFEK